MKIFKSMYAAAFLAIALFACESPVTNIPPEKLPQTESRLVVNSVISPQLPYITVLVTESVPLFSNSDAAEKRIENATVLLSDGVTEMKIPYDPENKLYSLANSKFPILTAKTYFLTVSDGKRTVTSQCTVPAKTPEIKSYDFDTLLTQNTVYQDTSVILKMSWQDLPVDTNYYRVNAGLDLEYTIPIIKNQQELKEERISLRHNFNWDWQQARNEFISDNNLDGAILNSPIGKVNLPQVLEKTYGNGKKAIIYPRTKIKSALIEVYSLDINYYKYQRSLEIRNNSDSPFAEPTSIYSNIVGGLGCFAAYNAAQIKISYSK